MLHVDALTMYMVKWYIYAHEQGLKYVFANVVMLIKFKPSLYVTLFNEKVGVVLVYCESYEWEIIF